MASEAVRKRRRARYGFVALASFILSVLVLATASGYPTRLGADLTLPFAVGPDQDRPPAPVSLVLIDEVTHRTAPFSETPEVAWTPAIAEILQAIRAAGPRVVGLDVIYPKTLDSPQFLPGFDRPYLEALAALGRDGRLVLSQVRLSDETIAPYRGQEIAVGGAPNIRPVVIRPDADSVIRRYPVEAPLDVGEAVPTFAAELARRAGRRATRDFLIDFRRAPSEIPAFRLSDLHHCLEKGDLRPFEAMKGQVVLIGVALDVEDRHVAANRFVKDKQPKIRSLDCAPPAAPTGAAERQTSPGVLIQAYAVDTIMRGSAPRMLGRPVAFIASFLIFFGLGAAYLAARPVIGAAIWAATSGLLFIAAIGLLERGLLAPWIQWGAGGLVLYSAVIGYRNRIEDKAKRLITHAFGRYLSPALVKQLTDDPDSLKLGGEHRRVAVMFTDFEGFTAYSEQHADQPERVVARLNTLFARISDIVEEHGGYVDKFLGDGVMAVWGAPLPSAEPEAAAARAALAIADAFDALALQAAAAGEMPLRIRIGLSAGVVLAGNLGSRRRFNYTVIGEPANRAARLQEACKTYEKGILADGVFAGALGRDFKTVLVAQTTLRGQSQAIEIWALLRPSAGAAGMLGLEP